MASAPLYRDPVHDGAADATLKTCALLRQRFLPYFTHGVLIGHCLLAQPAPEVRLSAYVLPDRVLAIVLNPGADGARTFRYDLTPWMPVHSGVQMTRTDEDGTTTPAEAVAPAGTLTTPDLKRLELAVYEFRAP